MPSGRDATRVDDAEDSGLRAGARVPDRRLTAAAGTKAVMFGVVEEGELGSRRRGVVAGEKGGVEGV